MNQDKPAAADDAEQDPLDRMLRVAAWAEPGPERVERLRRRWRSLSPAPTSPRRFVGPLAWTAAAAGLLAAVVLWQLVPREGPPIESAVSETAVVQRPSPEIVEESPPEIPEEIEIPPQDSPAEQPGQSAPAPAPPPIAPRETPVLEAVAEHREPEMEKPPEDPPESPVHERPADRGMYVAQSCEDLVREALLSEMAGDSQRRDELLRVALAADPEYAPARWHSGYVSMDDEWLSLDEVHQRFTADERLREYRQLRLTHAGNPMGELALARWCRSERLEIEARIHWFAVLQFQPNHKEALKNLGMRWYQGLLLTHDQIREKQAQMRQANRGKAKQPPQKEWSPLVLEWRRAVEEGRSEAAESMREELLAVEHHEGLQMLDSLVHGRRGSKKEQEALDSLSLPLIDLLGDVPLPWAGRSLARHALEHPIPEVRTAAADALAKHPKENYVPLLLASMRAPVEANISIIVLPDGGVSYRQSFYREGADADSLDVRHETSNIQSDWLYQSTDGTIPDWVPQASAQAARRSATLQAEAVRKAAAVERRVEEANTRASQLNRRIQAVLSRATGVDLGANPVDWYEWWDDYCYDYYQLEKPYRKSGGRKEKPVYESLSYGHRAYWIAANAIRPPDTQHSCFPRGTKVWTLTGPVGIEEIRRGDRVLSQHPESGELTYKPVLQTTIRDPSPMIKINLGAETIAATRGHPFWVPGEGWRMAKRLDAGSRLHGLSGAVSIAGVEEVPAEEALFSYGVSFNLIVDDFHTYFVGESRILVHDNRLFVYDQTSAPLPGLTRP
ncbi:MAG: hypothetical protein HQ582_09840 [Planctomycetes bacterium]|nr:hypothetical protein [Planctomycetota bacterium]